MPGHHQVVAEGEIDVAAVDTLRDAWDAVITEHRPDCLSVDCTRLTFIDAAGLGLLAGLHRRLAGYGASLIVTGLDPRLARLFRLTGLEHLLAGLGNGHEGGN